LCPEIGALPDSPTGRDARQRRLTCRGASIKMAAHLPKEPVMGRGDRRKSPKMRRKVSQRKKKAREKRKVEAKKAAKPAGKKK
jgi:hypothetical protein